MAIGISIAEKPSRAKGPPDNSEAEITWFFGQVTFSKCQQVSGDTGHAQLASAVVKVYFNLGGASVFS